MEITDFANNDNNLVDLPPFDKNPTDETDTISVTPPTPIPITIGGCIDSLKFDIGDVLLQSLGRILQLSLTIKNVCPNRRIAVAIFLTELDTNGDEYKRGMKILTVPAQKETACQDVTVDCINFILPEDLDVSEGLPTSICNDRRFYVRVMAQYIDYDFQICYVTV